VLGTLELVFGYVARLPIPKPSCKRQDAQQRNSHKTNWIKAIMPDPPKPSGSSDSKLDEILRRLGNLESRVNSLAQNNASGGNPRNNNSYSQNRQSRSPTPGNSRNQNRSKSRNDGPAPQSQGKPGLCSFHRRFGEKATRCTLPCEKNGQIYDPSQDASNKQTTN